MGWPADGQTKSTSYKSELYHMAATRLHTYLATALVGYVREGANKQRHLNQIVAVEERRIDLRTLEAAKHELIQRVITETGLSLDDIKDFIYLNFSYLGHMTEREFAGKAIPSSGPTAQTPFPH